MANGNFGGGNGTNLKPYLVEDAADLNAVRNNVSAHYKQTKDIDLSIYANWTPIGSYVSSDESEPFEGVYDGNNFKISNLKCTATGTSYHTGWDVGLFAKVNGATLKNINMENVNVTSYYDYAGALFGYMVYTDDEPILTIDNCTVVNSTISGEYACGGLFGWTSGRTSIRDCHVENTTIRNRGVGYGDYMGGLGGWCGECVKLEQCSFEGSQIPSDYTNAGLFAVLKSNINLIIKNCYAMVDLTNEGNAAGLFGELFTYGNIGTTITVENCYYKGNIKTSSVSGGIVGMGGINHITGCFVLSERIVGDAETYFADIIGDGNNPYSTVENCYTLNNINVANIQSIGKISAVESLDQETYISLADWDFKNVWEIKPGKTPNLKRIKKAFITCKRVPLNNYRR